MVIMSRSAAASTQPVRVVVGFTVDNAGRCLMAKRPAGALRPMWELPGGKRAPGETDAGALKREWQEELGVDPTHIEVVRRVNVKQYEFEVPFTIVTYFVKLDPAARPRPLASEELRWVHIGDAVKWLPCVPATFEAFPLLKGLPGVVPYAPVEPPKPVESPKPPPTIEQIMTALPGNLPVSVVTHSAPPTLEDQIRERARLDDQIRREQLRLQEEAQTRPRPNGFVRVQPPTVQAPSPMQQPVAAALNHLGPAIFDPEDKP